MAKDQHISKDDFFEIQVAGWFFDISRLEYWEDSDEGSLILGGLFKESGVDDAHIKPILKLLSADFETNAPISLTEQILSDPLRFHWTKKSFNLWNEALRKDTEFMEGREISVAEWLKQVLVYMRTYHGYNSPSKAMQRKMTKNLELFRGAGERFGASA